MNSSSKVLFAVMVFIWGSNWSIMKMGLNLSPPLTFTFHRLLVSLIFLFILIAVLKPKIPRDPKPLARIIAYSLVTTAAFALTILGLQSQSSGIAAVLTYTQPIMVSVMAVGLLGESHSVTRFLGLLLGLSGVALLFLEDAGSIISWGSVFLLQGAFLWGVGTVYYKLKLQNVETSLVNLVQVLTTCLVMCVLSVFAEPRVDVWGLGYLAIVAYSGIGATGIGLTIWLFLLKKEEVISLSGSSLIVPVVALFFGFLVLGEYPTLRSVAGSTLVLVGIYLINSRDPRKSVKKFVNQEHD